MGNKCSDGGIQSAPMSLNDLASIPLGGRRTGQGCVPDILGTQGGSGYDWAMKRGFGFPGNGEFEFGLGEGCQMCSDPLEGYGCEANGCKSIGGRRPVVKRVDYKADPVACCIKGNMTENGATCAPEYRGMASSGCNSVMQNYCTPDKVFTGDCEPWANANMQLSRASALAYCTANPGDDKCKSFCNKLSASGDTGCDSIYTTYCDANPSDPYCACMKSAATNKFAVIPVCFDSKCIQSDAYKTVGMRTTKCPDVVNCEIQAQLINSGISVGNNFKIEQNCGKKEEPVPPPKPSGSINTSPGGSQPGTYEPSSSIVSETSGITIEDNPRPPAEVIEEVMGWQPMSLYFWVFVFLIIVALIVGLVFAFDDDDETNEF